MRSIAVLMLVAMILVGLFTPRLVAFGAVIGDQPTTAVPLANGVTLNASTSSNLTALSCPSTSTCYAVGDSGTILATTNGGASWSLQSSGTSAYLKGISCSNPSTCYAVGDSGTILATTNGGASWTHQSSNTSNSLLAISCPSWSTCAAVGIGGVIRTTVNGGSWWSSQSSGTSTDLYGVSCPTTATCFAAGLDGTILLTTNAGSWWQTLNSGTSQYLHGVYCPFTVTICYAAGANGTILTTVNGGVSWGAQSSGSIRYLHAVSCTSIDACAVVGDGGTILTTSNGGASWSAQSSGTMSYLHGVACPSTTCFAAGDGGTVLSFTIGSSGPSPTATPTGGGGGGGSGGQNYPRLANVEGFGSSGQAATFARYGLLISVLQPASSGATAAVQALKNQNTGTKAVFYVDTLSVDVPGFDGMSIYPGWWLTLAGTTLTASLDASSTTVHVANAAVINNYLSSNPDVLVDGESMHVTSVNVSANTLTVQRGYNSTATSHSSGARLAAHATKWYGTWMLNVTSYCPTNPSTGQTWTAYLAQKVQQTLAAAPWDGAYLDDSNTSVANMDNGQIDANNDNVADGGDGPSGNGWVTGVSNLFSHIHSLSPNALIVGNGAVYSASSGREMEHFPNFNGGYASGFETYLQLAGPQGTAPSTILNADTNNTGNQSLQSMRFNLATTLMGNGYYAYDYGTQLHGQTWWYDEYDDGAGSSLASSISWNQTNLPLAPGTGSRFHTGDVVRVPETAYSPSVTDDEQMLVTGVSGDTLYVQRGYNGTVASWHAAQVKVFTAAQEAAGQGWLGQPLGPATSVSSGGANQLQNGSFEQGGSGWLPPWSLGTSGGASAGASQDTSTAASGSASARISVNSVVSSSPWDIQLSQGGLSTYAGTTYTLSFWAKSSANQQVMASIQQTVSPYGGRAKQWFTLTPNWAQYFLTFTAANTEGNLGAVFNLGSSTGTIWLDGLNFAWGDPNLWRRDFTHGTVLLNATNSSQTVNVGSGYARIAGTQDPSTNSGASVTSVTIPAQDAILLRKTG